MKRVAGQGRGEDGRSLKFPFYWSCDDSLYGFEEVVRDANGKKYIAGVEEEEEEEGEAERVR